ncbi:MAG: DMT family transporter [Anaerolineae bacterium]
MGPAESAAGGHTGAAGRAGVWLAVAAVSAFSTAPVLVLWAAPLSAFEITLGRLLAGAAALWLLARLSRQPHLPARADLLRFAGIGFITALHFLCYIASLNFTTIAHALALVYTAPIFVALFSAWFLKEPSAPRKWLGVFVTVAGIAILAGFEPRLNSRMIVGDLLALVSAVTYALYSIAGRSQRTRYPLFTYAGTVYGLAALWAAPAAALSFTPSAYTWRSVLALLGAGLIPLAAGHTLYNAALRRVHATVPNLIATQEVTGGIVLGALLLGQIPQANEVIGAAVALLGIALVLV